MASYRHLARIAVMQALFAHEFRAGTDPKKTLDYCMEEYGDKLQSDDFAIKLLEGVLSHLDEIYKVMQEQAPEWPVDRIARIDRAILAIGIYEILFSDDVPPVVAINEGVEIAKGYGDLNSPKFINGVLSGVMSKKKSKQKE